MPRRRKVAVRMPAPDAQHQSVLVSKIINKILLNGKKSTATRLVYAAMTFAAQKLQKEPLAVLELAVKNVTPLIEVRSKRIGGGNYQIPTEVKPHRREALAIRWLISFARSRKGKSMEESLGLEIIDAYNKTGGAYKRKEDTHKMAESNRAFAHFSKAS